MKRPLIASRHWRSLLIATSFAWLPALAADGDSIGLVVPSFMTEPFLGDFSGVANRHWYGMYCKRDYCNLRPAEVKVKTLKAMDCSGKQVAASRLTYVPPNPVFLIDHKLGDENKIASILHYQGQKITRRETRQPRDGTTTWEVQLPARKKYGVVFPQSHDDNAACVKKGSLPIRVFAKNKLQTTWSRNICGEEALDIPQEFDITWAGDLDADGKLDLLITLPQGPYMLLLSSRPDDNIRFAKKFPNKPAC